MEFLKFDSGSLLLIFFPIILVLFASYILKLLGLKRKSKHSFYSYTLRQSVLSKPEAKFFNVLKQVAGDQYIVLTKIRLADIFLTKNGQGYYSALNKISSKHIDFLLCDPRDFSPALAIEVDDRSHLKRKRMDRDEFVDQLFSTTGLKLVRFKASIDYDLEFVRKNIFGNFNSTVGN